jgi:hypothetical protein
MFRATANPRLPIPDAGDAVDSPQIGEAASLTLLFRLGRGTSRKLVAALSGNQCL